MAEGGFDPEEIPLLENQDQEISNLSSDRQVDDFYQYFKLAGREDVPLVLHYEKFHYREGKGLFYKREGQYGDMLLTDKRNPDVVFGLDTITKNAKAAGNTGSGEDTISAQDFIRFKLGFKNFKRSVQKAESKLKSIQPESIPMEQQPQISD